MNSKTSSGHCDCCESKLEETDEEDVKEEEALWVDDGAACA